MSVRIKLQSMLVMEWILLRQVVCSGTKTTCGVGSSRKSAEVLAMLLGCCDTSFVPDAESCSNRDELG